MYINFELYNLSYKRGSKKMQRHFCFVGKTRILDKHGVHWGVARRMSFHYENYMLYVNAKKCCFIYFIFIIFKNINKNFFHRWLFSSIVRCQSHLFIPTTRNEFLIILILPFLCFLVYSVVSLWTINMFVQAYEELKDGERKYI